jgi:LPXTG-site transpeptidase (sortase) family protein
MAQAGNVFILGHSSYLPTVLNKNFQAFNGIQDLAWGDKIEVTSEGYVLTYEVEKVYKAKAADVTIPVADTGARLTLATCNSFGSKDDRFIVEAKRIDVRAL